MINVINLIFPSFGGLLCWAGLLCHEPDNPRGAHGLAFGSMYIFSCMSRQDDDGAAVTLLMPDGLGGGCCENNVHPEKCHTTASSQFQDLVEEETAVDSLFLWEKLQLLTLSDPKVHCGASPACQVRIDRGAFGRSGPSLAQFGSKK